MDSNYEAQSQLARQRIAARRKQAQAERLLRAGQPESRHGLQQLFLRLFQVFGRRRAQETAEPSRSTRLAIAGKGDGK